jgi:hypothetical protein
MKTILKLLAVLAVLAGGVAACQGGGGDAQTDQSMTLSKQAVTLAPEGGSEIVTLIAPAAWTATSTAEWLKVNPASGNSGTFNISVSADKNASGQDRSGMVTFSAGNKSASLTANQKAIPQDPVTPEDPPTPGTIDGYNADVIDWDEGEDSTYHKD